MLYQFLFKTLKGRLPLIYRLLRSLWRLGLLLGTPVLILGGVVIKGFVYSRYDKIAVRNLCDNRIGHLAINTELYLRRSLQEHGRTLHLLLCSGEPVANGFLLSMIERKVRVLRFSVLHLLFSRLARRDPGYWDMGPDGKGTLPYSSNEFYELNELSPQLSFTAKEEQAGEEILASMHSGNPYVCFHSRDSQYLQVVSPYVNFDYHDFRNSEIESFTQAAMYLAEQGIYAIRMGHCVTKPLSVNNSKIIDYASNHRSEFGDIYLTAKCKFFLGTTAGLVCVAQIFNVPTAYVDWVPLKYAPPLKRDLFITKKLWSIADKRFLTFREIVTSPVGHFMESQQYVAAGIEPIANTAAEILAVTREMNERIDGTWVETEEDRYLQQRFRDLFPPGCHCYGFPSRIGADFLRENRQLLE